MQQLLKHLKFLPSATNQHGVHSPFIYGYVTKCLYGKKKYSRSKSLNVLFKSIAYFGSEQIMLQDSEDELKRLINNYFPEAKFVLADADIIYLSNKDTSKVEVLLSKKINMNNNTMLLLDGIYESKQSEAIWKTLKNNPKVTVTVDMFYCGAVFFREEQAKEHFKIRI
ncbi:hypothetical protein [Zobellia barbeyronii]|uniref:Uncharacterized protein n=1 Tax=Zobellia barbeyronii TaxID=2748009 RepID=A0ABS5WJ35_9FLAO|nr:hypothetical protein [Zobellia barbeyronii]MBT2163413.1 hypothetical protein [Zobellia barbeyronii]